ncbi:Serpentine Receptor, class T [Caenorhabditis elegans]|uniref:Serpentine Receptor, class T n=1 Tax=Caenorhabditis elegans TaxID=6239 RepID=P91552_CAEEL|nr:Serpentine Receptor, class T [Caenorhabditis elegans]CCD64934.1 Serpentine Receptor, class T [Caenorhabditis elegans]|eukprot:NP_494470.1 Serpentine Receptor, class I [Caenorhabditis elegans]
MSLDFSSPNWLILYFNIVSFISFFLNCTTILLIIFKSYKFNNFRFFVLVFQVTCTITDLHINFIMQPVPMLPVWACRFEGVGLKFLGIWPNYLMAAMFTLVGFQFNSLGLCFLKKHQIIKNTLRRNSIPNWAYIAFIISTLPLVALIFISVLQIGVSKEKSIEFSRTNYPQYGVLFSKISNLMFFDSNLWAVGVLFISGFGGCLLGAIVSMTTLDMFKMLGELRRRVSFKNYARHRSVVRSLLAQCAATAILLLPGAAIFAIFLYPDEKSREISQIIVCIYALRSSASSVILVITTPPYRTFIIRKFASKLGVKASPAMGSTSIM